MSAGCSIGRSGRDLIEFSPVARIEKPTPERARDRVLTDAELVTIWRAAERMGGPFGAGVQLLMASGARREEIFGASRGELDREARCLRLPAARSKSGQGRIIPLSPLAMGVVDKLPTFAGGDWLLTIDGKRAYRAFSVGKAKLDQTAAEIAGAPLAAWVPARSAPNLRHPHAGDGSAPGGYRGRARPRFRQPLRHCRRVPAPCVHGRGRGRGGRLGRLSRRVAGSTAGQGLPHAAGALMAKPKRKPPISMRRRADRANSSPEMTSLEHTLAQAEQQARELLAARRAVTRWQGADLARWLGS